MIEASAFTAVSTEILKFSFGRQRPNETEDPDQWFDGGDSFPSGHVGLAFAIDPRWFYYLSLLALAGVVVAMRRLENSRLGRAWVAVREDELAASAMGISATRVKLSAFAMSSEAVTTQSPCCFAERPFFSQS